MKRSVLGTAKDPEVQEIQSSNSPDSLTTVEIGRLVYGREGGVAVFSAGAHFNLAPATQTLPLPAAQAGCSVPSAGTAKYVGFSWYKFAIAPS